MSGDTEPYVGPRSEIAITLKGIIKKLSSIQTRSSISNRVTISVQDSSGESQDIEFSVSISAYNFLAASISPKEDTVVEFELCQVEYLSLSAWRFCVINGAR